MIAAWIGVFSKAGPPLDSIMLNSSLKIAASKTDVSYPLDESKNQLTTQTCRAFNILLTKQDNKLIAEQRNF